MSLLSAMSYLKKSIPSALSGGELSERSLDVDPSPSRAPHSFQVPRAGFVFCIEDISMREGKLLPGVCQALNFVLHHDIPFIFLTNGDGFDDADQGLLLSKQLQEAGVKLTRHHILARGQPFGYLLSSNPDLALPLSKKNVLIIGGHGHKNVVKLAKRCGFKKVWTPETLGARTDVPIFAVLIWSTSDDWDRDMNIIINLGTSATTDDIPVIVCNEDFDRATGHAYRHLGIDCAVVVHMLKGRLGSENRWADWMTETPQKLALTDHCRISMADHSGFSIYKQAERLLEEFSQYGNSYSGLNRDILTPRGASPLETIYLVTEDSVRDLKGLERHSHQSTPGGPMWRVFHVAGGAYPEGLRFPQAGEPRSGRVYQPVGVCATITDAMQDICTVQAEANLAGTEGESSAV
ncbi:hypothetical protein B0T25DRAFT_596274 [Lasiosphaeria hispida]|uniref:Cat eye syndrome critical region protein 5 n=1 Tax=Lasiosphaeria hispida TaxID=260671 RepID=A0AAJ0HV68_9PEZI|nr:hypothetical protein B0T25DRAFT_596274 [Lasiosphaeria hispida]